MVIRYYSQGKTLGKDLAVGMKIWSFARTSLDISITDLLDGMLILMNRNSTHRQITCETKCALHKIRPLVYVYHDAHSPVTQKLNFSI